MYTSNNRRRVTIFLLIGILAVLLLVLMVKLFFIDSGIDYNATVAKVNNEPISFREFKFFMAENQAETMNYFREKYGADVNDKDFWEKSFGEEVPVETLKQKTLTQLIRIKVQQILAKEKGLAEDISYAGFLNRLEDENKRRKEALAKNEIIYGPQQYGEKEFFYYNFNNMVNDLEEVMGKEELSADNIQLKEYYEEMKEKYYKYPDTIKVNRISVNYSMKGNDNTLSEDQAEEEIKEYARQIKMQSFDAVAAQVENRQNSNYTYEEQIFEMKNRKEDLNNYETIIEIGNKLSKGQISEVFQDEDRHCFSIIKCVEKKDNGYKDFEEVKELVKISYTEETYHKLIDKMVEESNIWIDRELVDEIEIY